MQTKITHNRIEPLLLVAGFVAAILRVWYWMSVKGEPWFQTPGMDPEFYRTWASAILGGHSAEYIPFPRAPLYAYLLASMLKITDLWWLPRLFNLMCDLTSLTLIWSLARRVAGVRGGFIAALIFAVSGMAIYQSGELLMTSLETALATLYIYFLIRAIDNFKPEDGLIAGLTLGLFSLCRPNGLALIAIMPIFLLIIRNNKPARTYLTTTMFALGAVIALLPVTYLNYEATGKLIPVATQGGVNFYIGNSHESNGWASSLPGEGADWTDADAIRIAELDAGQKLSSDQVSSQFWKMGFREINSAPLKWLRLMGRKFLLLCNIRELGNNRPLGLPVVAAPFLWVLLFVSPGAVLALAIPGFYFARKDRSVMIVCISFLAIYGGSLLLFFVSGRYRMPLLPVMAVFAGIGFSEFPKYWRNRSLRSPLITTMTAGVLLTLPPWTGTNSDNPAQGYFVAGNALLKQGRAAEAIELYTKASRLDDRYPNLHLNLGVANMTAGDTSKAIGEFQKEIAIDPTHAEAFNNLAVIAEQRGNLEKAEGYYNRAIILPVGSENAKFNLMRLSLRLGDRFFQAGKLDSAMNKYGIAADFSVTDPRPNYRMAIINASLGNFEEARLNLLRSLTLQPDYLPARQLLHEMELQK